MTDWNVLGPRAVAILRRYVKRDTGGLSDFGWLCDVYTDKGPTQSDELALITHDAMDLLDELDGVPIEEDD